MSWKSLLLDYVDKERDPAAKAFLQKHINQNSTNMISELKRQAEANIGFKQLRSPYGGGNGSGTYPKVDYDGLFRDVMQMVDQCKTAEAQRQAILAPLPRFEQEDAEAPSKNVEVTKRLKVFEPFETGAHVPLLEANYQAPLSLYTNAPINSTTSECKHTTSTTTLSLQVAKSGVSSSLKRKHEVIDLT